MLNSRSAIFHSLIGLAIVAISLVSLTVGSVDLPLDDVIAGLTDSGDETLRLIVQELRLPRLIIGLMAGATLGMMGAALQGLLRNPLADPGVLGVSASASLGAVIAIYYGLAASFAFSVPLLAMAGAAAATLILFMLSARDNSVLSLVLVGIGIGSLATALMALFINFAPTAASLRDMIMWLLGSLENRTTSDLMMAGPFIILGWIFMLGTGQGLNALTLGEDAALSLGINLKRLRWQVIVGCALSVGAAVSVCGAIGFVGLVVPHIIRAILGPAPGNLLMPSALLGAFLLTAADLLTRLPADGQQLRLGVVTALVGAPLFLLIIYRTRGAMR